MVPFSILGALLAATAVYVILRAVANRKHGCGDYSDYFSENEKKRS